MSIVPFRKTERQRRQPLDQAQVVRAALALLDEVGLDELTMRRLAERLGVKAASLYRHVKSKDELLVLLADEITAKIPLVEPAGSWRDQLARAAWNARAGLLSHRDAARVLANTAPIGPRRLQHVESLLRILRSAGLSKRDAARVGHLCNNLVTEFAADEARFAALAAASGASRKKVFADARRYFKSLPKTEFPMLVDLADYLTEDDPDALFRSSIEVMLNGIEKLAKRSSD